MDVSGARSAAWWWPSSRASRSSPWRSGSPSPCSTWPCCATGSWSASTVAILIGAGTINALMYLVSLYFQDPSTLGLSPLQAGLATLPATAGLVAVAPFVPRFAARFGGRQVVGAGFAITAVGFALVGLRRRLVALCRIRPAARSPSPSGWDSPTGRPRRRRRHASRRTRSGRPPVSPTWPATSARPWPRRSPRRSTETSSRARTDAGQSQVDALSSGLSAASWTMAVFSLVGRRDGRGHGSSFSSCPGHPRRLRGGCGRSHAHPADVGHPDPPGGRRRGRRRGGVAARRGECSRTQGTAGPGRSGPLALSVSASLGCSGFGSVEPRWIGTVRRRE